MSLDETPESIGAALGRIPSGCSILTVEYRGRSTGVLVSWVQQAAFEPLALTVCLRQGRPAGRLLAASKRFLLNVLGEDPAPLFKHFARGFALEENAFGGLDICPTEYGPMIAGCVAYLGCTVRDTVSAGDHDVYVAEVEAGEVQGGARPYVHTRKSGLTY